MTGQKRVGAKRSGWGAALAALLVSSPAAAHDPIFGLGPHVLYKGGVEVAPEVHLEKKGEEQETELGLELVYGITGDWAAGIELPYARKEEGAESASGTGDMSLFTKYRFWRHDTLGVQESAAVLLKVKTDTGDENAMPALGAPAPPTPFWVWPMAMRAASGIASPACVTGATARTMRVSSAATRFSSIWWAAFGPG